MDILDLMKNLTIKNTNDPSCEHIMRSTSTNINDVETFIVYAEYSDKTLVIICQYEKIGSMMMVHKEQSPLGTNDIIYTTKVIFGATGEEQEVAARYIAEAINITKPLLIFINLKTFDMQTVSACKDILLLEKNKQN